MGETVNNVPVGVEDQIPETIKWFKGFPLFSFDGIMLWGLILLFISLGVFGYLRFHTSLSIIQMITFSVIIFAFSCFRWHYFGISNSKLFIKNYNLPWIKNNFRLQDIKEVVFEEAGARSTIIRMKIIMKNLSTRMYPGGTLRSKKWMDLKAELESKGIKVRNESVIYDGPVKFKLFDD